MTFDSSNLIEIMSGTPYFQEFLWNVSDEIQAIKAGEGTDREKKVAIAKVFHERYRSIDDEVRETVAFKIGFDIKDQVMMSRAVEHLKRIQNGKRKGRESES